MIIIDYLGTLSVSYGSVVGFLPCDAILFPAKTTTLKISYDALTPKSNTSLHYFTLMLLNNWEAMKVSEKLRWA